MTRIDTCKENISKLGVRDNDLASKFPAFEAIKNRFIYGEVWNQGSMEDQLRSLVVVAILTTVEGTDLDEQIKVALHIGVTPEALLEVFHQAAPYIGFPRAEKGLRVLAQAFEDRNIEFPLQDHTTVTEDTRLEVGINVQKSIFGNHIDTMRANAPDDQKFIQDYLSAYCFGDTYTRTGLELKTRELITFVCLVGLGDTAAQMKSHVAGNLAVGNTKEDLIGAVNQCLPYIGFPRTLNALAVINEVATEKR
jgi:4-carboxymuconolactone decarboxylase